MSKKRNLEIKPTYIIGGIFICICLFSFLFFLNFNQKITPKLLSIAQASINRLNESILMQYKVSDLYKQINMEDIIQLTKNNQDEIISVDFKLENAYDSLSLITTYLHNSLENSEIRNNILKYYNKDLSSRLDSIVLSI